MTKRVLAAVPLVALLALALLLPVAGALAQEPNDDEAATTETDEDGEDGEAEQDGDSDETAEGEETDTAADEAAEGEADAEETVEREGPGTQDRVGGDDACPQPHEDDAAGGPDGESAPEDDEQRAAVASQHAAECPDDDEGIIVLRDPASGDDAADEPDDGSALGEGEAETVAAVDDEFDGSAAAGSDVGGTADTVVAPTRIDTGGGWLAERSAHQRQPLGPVVALLILFTAGAAVTRWRTRASR